MVLVALALSALWLVARYVRWVDQPSDRDRPRVIERQGYGCRARGREIPLAALTDISYHQTLLERVIGAGDVVLESAGRGEPGGVPRPAQPGLDPQRDLQADAGELGS